MIINGKFYRPLNDEEDFTLETLLSRTGEIDNLYGIKKVVGDRIIGGLLYLMDGVSEEYFINFYEHPTNPDYVISVVYDKFYKIKNITYRKGIT